MAVANVQGLSFTVSLLDKMTAPAAKMKSSLDGLAGQANKGFATIRGGMTGLVATGASLYAALAPGVDTLRALGEVKSLGVVQSELDSLEKSATKFSAHYNESASEFIRSSYDIQSAISGLNNGELAKFTTASGTLAKATKSDTGVITSYVGMMFGIFQAEANKMGKAQWVEMLAGKTATAVQLFKTTGPKMASAFAATGASATSMGIQISEQIGILGTLQSSMEGSEAGTKYRAFLKGVGNAQKSLGLDFTDTQGKMLPMVEILQRIKGKYGDIDTVAKSDMLQKAFGSDEAVALVKLLSTNINGLGDSINKVGEVKGMEKATEMAEAMLTPFDRMAGGARALHNSFSTLLTRSMEPLFNGMASGFKTALRWSEMFPHLTALVGKLAVFVVIAAAAISVLAVVWGITQVAAVGLGFGISLLSGLWSILTYKISLNAIALGLVNGYVKTSMAISTAWAVATKFCTAITTGWAGAMRILNLVMLANPIGLIIAGIVLLGIAIAVIVWKWDAITAAFKNTEWGQAIIAMCTDLFNWFGKLGGVWDSLVEKFNNFHPLQSLANFFGGGDSSAGATVPGIPQSQLAGAVQVPGLRPENMQMPGGAGGQIANAITQGGGKGGMYIGTQNINSSDPLTPEKVAHLAQFAA